MDSERTANLGEPRQMRYKWRNRRHDVMFLYM